MISLALAQFLADAGLEWQPRPGDVFVIVDRDMDDEVFYLADMTIEVQHFTDGNVIGFNGTVEWALDSVDLTDTLWLPREDQLRELLGDRFIAVRRGGDGWVVDVRDGDAPGEVSAPEVDEAYGRALLAILRERP